MLNAQCTMHNVGEREEERGEMWEGRGEMWEANGERGAGGSVFCPLYTRRDGRVTGRPAFVAGTTNHTTWSALQVNGFFAPARDGRRCCPPGAGRGYATVIL